MTRCGDARIADRHCPRGVLRPPVTVPGLPRRGRRRSSKDHEKSPRDWYGGAVGLLDFDSNMNTELTLRTIRVKDGIAQVRAARLYCTTPIRELLGPSVPILPTG